MADAVGSLGTHRSVSPTRLFDISNAASATRRVCAPFVRQITGLLINFKRSPVAQ